MVVPMLGDKKIVVVMPAFNAASTIERFIGEIDRTIVDESIVVDDSSRDATTQLAHACGVSVLNHDRNRGYGANQRTCCHEALLRGADIVVMGHVDYQYSPKLIPALAALVASGHYDVALGSRILGNGARSGGMPGWRYVANRALTAIENALIGRKLSEYHTGLRAWSRVMLEVLPLDDLSDDFVFGSQSLALAVVAGATIGELSCPTRYFGDASSINFRRSIRYGFGVLGVSVQCREALRGGPRGVFRGLTSLSDSMHGGCT